MEYQKSTQIQIPQRDDNIGQWNRERSSQTGKSKDDQSILEDHEHLQ